MASINTLTDSELRKKLLEYGYDLPISINRDFLITKLTSVTGTKKKSEPANLHQRIESASVCGRRKERYSNYLNLFRTGEDQGDKQSPLYSSKNFSDDESEEEEDESSPTNRKVSKFGGFLNPFNWTEKSKREVNTKLDRTPYSDAANSSATIWNRSSVPASTGNGHTSGGSVQKRSTVSGRFTGNRNQHVKAEDPIISKVIVIVLILSFIVIGGLYLYKGIYEYCCSIYESVSSLLSYLMFLMIGAFVLIVCGKVILHYRKLKKIEEQEMFDIIEHILELLYQHYEKSRDTDEKPFLAVNHIRDELVPPKERQSKAALWNRVAEHISTTESRVREEMQHISGEEYKVWRWLPNASPLTASRKSLSSSNLPAHLPNLSLSDSDSGNKWQGQAFELNDGSPNALPAVTPTSCLKIRQMFDATSGTGPELYEKIENTILDKCGDAFILHIGMDKGSAEGCVYVKCASKEDARKAYMALHGWWFDGHLLSVKFLREERYITRFPSVKDRRTRLVLKSKNRIDGNNGMEPHFSMSAKKSF